MLFETPDDTYNAYIRFLKKKEYKKAYSCLEKMLHQFPDDTELLGEIVDLCVFCWKRPDLSRQWLIRLAKITSSWLDYLLLSQVEADSGNISTAREYLKNSRKLQKTQPWNISEKKPQKIFSEVEELIKHREWNIRFKGSAPDNVPNERPQVGKLNDKAIKPAKGQKGKGMPAGKIEKNRRQLSVSPPALLAQAPVLIPTYSIPVKIEPFNKEIFSSLIMGGRSTLQEIRMLIDYTHLAIQSGFDDLLCLNAITGIEKYWYQTETVKKALKYFHGRVLLCDEVGLGKTIEAGMLIKEYLMRGMVRNILILTPAPLVSQWKEEMRTKFGIAFLTTDDQEYLNDPSGFWKERNIISSINIAKGNKNAPLISDQFYDLVVVDEAHHLKNRETLGWKLVNQIKKRFIFLLTATPVQNNLIELFNLITLLKPGQFKTEKVFKQEYVMKGNLKAPANKERLRDLLRDVMIRNTRSAIDLKLPKRFATTLRLESTEVERMIYKMVTEHLRKGDQKRQMVNLLLREAGSSPFALKKNLLNMADRDGVKEIIDAIDSLSDISKGKALIDILIKNTAEKKVVFTQFVKSMDYVSDLLSRHDIPYLLFKGDMSLKEKDKAIAGFKDDIPVLISTESGGEGRNMQFCNTIINFDLPWNPMRIEQRIGRLHRIGQIRDVFIFNLSVKETIEDYIIDILDNKINMFEMVIGEIEPILGIIGEDKDFDDIIFELWLNSGDDNEIRDGFEKLGNDLADAKREYLKTKEMDTEIFGEEYEI
ncbi:MAG: DEAD/DEAH box helicase family protein [Nitrospirae bacterium]|nr:DEAD/DEAH box helicase family protein [Nitrospirota bacterium]